MESTVSTNFEPVGNLVKSFILLTLRCGYLRKEAPKQHTGFISEFPSRLSQKFDLLLVKPTWQVPELPIWLSYRFFSRSLGECLDASLSPSHTSEPAIPFASSRCGDDHSGLFDLALS